MLIVVKWSNKYLNLCYIDRESWVLWVILLTQLFLQCLPFMYQNALYANTRAVVCNLWLLSLMWLFCPFAVALFGFDKKIAWKWIVVSFFNIIIAVRLEQLACFRCVPAPAHLVQMNGSLSDLSRAWQPADHLNQGHIYNMAWSPKKLDGKLLSESHFSILVL